jgi:signal transduction histidine kinase
VQASGRPGRGVRSQVGRAILAVAALAVLLFAVPLAVAANRLFRADALAELQREAGRAAALVSTEIDEGTAAPRLPPPLRAGVRLGLYRADGRRVAGVGPPTTALARQVAADGGEHDEVGGGELAAAVPLRDDRQDFAVRAAASSGPVLLRTWTAVGGMAVLALAVLAPAALLGRRRAIRIAAPLEELTVAARRLGDGDFTVRPPPSGVREADEAGRSLASTARRLGELVERERSFSADASHQIRTPLTAVRLGLEATRLDPALDPRAAIDTALDRLDRVGATVEELLARARNLPVPVGRTDVAAVLRQAWSERWSELAAARGRSVLLDLPDRLPPALASPAVLHQVLDVLVTNGLEHGAGTVLIAATIRDLDGGLIVSVSDEGPGFGPVDEKAAFARGQRSGAGNGIGLSLARSLAESTGARLVLLDAGPRPVLGLVLPRSPD